MLEGLEAFTLVSESTRRFVASIAQLSDAQIDEATLIPPWTRGHVITHVARAADSYRRLLAGASNGVQTPQYPSMAFRADQIDAGASRSVEELVSDVTVSSARFEEAMRSLPPHAWRAQVRMRPGELRAPAALRLILLRELEVHHVDLAVGYRFADIATDTAQWIIDDILLELRRRNPIPALSIKAVDTGLSRELAKGAPLISGTQADLLAWLSGRSPGTGLSNDGAVQIPVAAYWI